MPELETGFLPPLDTNPTEDDESVTDSEAPYGRKADGTPRAKPGRKSGSSGGTVSSRRGSANDEAFKERISEELVELSAPIGVISPLAMLHVAERADRTANALAVVAKKHPAVKAAILTYFDSVAYKDLVLFVVGIPVAIMIDMGVPKPDAVAGRVWHFQEKYEELYGEGGSEFEHGNGNGVVPARGLAGEL